MVVSFLVTLDVSVRMWACVSCIMQDVENLHCQTHSNCHKHSAIIFLVLSNIIDKVPVGTA